MNETLARTRDNLTVSRIDPHVETERCRRHGLVAKGTTLEEAGHTRQFDATGAHDREIQRPMGGKARHFRTPMMHLQEPKQSKVLLLTLAETTPVLAAAKLQADLRRRCTRPWAGFINNIAAAAHRLAPPRRQRVHQARAGIDAAATRQAQRVAMDPSLADEPIGVDRLLARSRPGGL